MRIDYFMSMIKRTVFLILLIFVEVIEHYRVLSVYVLSIYCCLQRLLAKSGFVYHIWLSCFLFTRFKYKILLSPLLVSHVKDLFAILVVFE